MTSVNIPGVGRVNFPDGMSAQDIEAALQGIQPPAESVQATAGPAAPDRGMFGEGVRKAEMAARGFSDSALETLGAVPDLLGKGMRAVGIPGAPREGLYTDTLKRGWNAVGEVLSAPLNAAFPGVMEGEKTVADRAVYGGGRGVADAAAVMLPAAGVARSAKAGGLTEGVSRTLASQPVAQMAAGATGGVVGEATGNPWLGMAASMATPAAATAARRAVTPFPTQLSAKEQATVNLAKDLGIDLTAGQQTGSRFLQATESQLAKLPFSGPRQQAIYDAQRGALNKSVLEKAGILADNVSPELIDDAYRTIGRQLDDLAKQTRVKITPEFFDQVDKVAGDYGRRLPTDVKPVFQSYMDDLAPWRKALEQGADVVIDGEEFQNIASGLKRAARDAKTRSDLENALNGLVDSLDNAMVASADPEVAKGWKEANRLYRNLLTIDDAVRSGAVGDRVAGDIPVSGLKRAVQKKDVRGFSRGRGDFADDVRVGEFIQDRIPNSGTPERTVANNILTGALGPGTGFGAMAAGVDPVSAAAIGAASYVVPPLTQKLLASDLVKQYLTNQWFTPPTGRLATQLMLAREKDRQLNPRYR